MSTINSSINLTQDIINGLLWPITINGGTVGEPTIVTLGENILLTSGVNGSANGFNTPTYFVIKSEYVTFDGNNHTVTINNFPNYHGLLMNGSSPESNSFRNDSFDNVTVTSLNVTVSGTTTPATTSWNETGWICRKWFGRDQTNVSILKSHTDGIIPKWGGGIHGGQGDAIITDCYSTGNANSSTGSGGITGNSGIYTISQCYSTGSGFAHGIGDNINGTVDNCYCNHNSITNGGAIVTNSYAYNGTWDNDTANSTLTGATDGSVWKVPGAFVHYGISIPYTLKAFLQTSRNSDRIMYNPASKTKIYSSHVPFVVKTIKKIKNNEELYTGTLFYDVHMIKMYSLNI